MNATRHRFFALSHLERLSASLSSANRLSMYTAWQKLQDYFSSWLLSPLPSWFMQGSKISMVEEPAVSWLECQVFHNVAGQRWIPSLLGFSFVQCEYFIYVNVFLYDDMRRQHISQYNQSLSLSAWDHRKVLERLEEVPYWEKRCIRCRFKLFCVSQIITNFCASSTTWLLET